VSNPRRIWLLDASIYIFRAWFSLPDRWHTDCGMPLNAVYGYASSLFAIRQRVPRGDILAAAFDESLGSCFRNDIYPGYKASRELPDEALAFQLASCRELTGLAGIACYAGPRYEADDYLACLARLAREENLSITVITRDKDLGQLLLSDHDQWWDAAADRVLDRGGFLNQFGVHPHQFADYLALVGDSIDDIPGVPGVGPKTAALLLQALDSLETIAARPDDVAALPIRGAACLPEKLEAHWPQLQLSRRLACLQDEIEGVEELPDYSPGANHATAVADYLESLSLRGPVAGRWRAAAGNSAA
jgi:5'-3' exonuclease